MDLGVKIVFLPVSQGMIAGLLLESFLLLRAICMKHHALPLACIGPNRGRKTAPGTGTAKGAYCPADARPFAEMAACNAHLMRMC